MGKFFQNQKLDAPGLIGITLQKLLIFFMVLDVLGMFSGSFFTSFIALLFHFVVFMGAYRRRTAVLCMYVVVHIVLFVLIGLVLIVAVASMMYMPPEQYGPSIYDSGDYVYYGNNTTTYYANKALRWFSPNSTVHPTPNNGTVFIDPPMSNSDISASEGSEYGLSDTWLLLLIVLLLLSFIILYTKILSVVLAHRMRKMLLAIPTLPVNAPSAPAPTEPAFIPADFEAQQQYWAAHQAAYYMQVPQEDEYPGNQGAMMPPPFMYGNQPVFYTYAPMAPQQPPKSV